MNVEPTATNPLGLAPEDQHDLCRRKLRETYSVVSALEPSRERSTVLTKLDEARHWLEDDRRMKELKS